jgi:hypothetical protein
MLVYEMEAYPRLPRSKRRTDDVSLRPSLKLWGQQEVFLEQDFSVSPELAERNRDSRRNVSCHSRLRLDISDDMYHSIPRSVSGIDDNLIEMTADKACIDCIISVNASVSRRTLN